MKKRILIAYTFLADYRVPIFRQLASKYELTVSHSGRPIGDPNVGFSELILGHLTTGRLHFQRGLLSEVRNGRFDAVIFFLDVAWLSTIISFICCPRSSKRITWGAWKTSSNPANLLRKVLLKWAHANIFYGPEALHDFVMMGVPSDKNFVARNTVEVKTLRSEHGVAKDTILFVGSLDPRKQNEIALKAFANIVDKISPNIRFVIIGDGVMKGPLKELVADLGVGSRVHFVPAITDPVVLSENYARAIASVSFGQAGLSVLQSLGYGVPFITKENAISGGEINNLKDGYNALLCSDDLGSLEAAMLRVCLDPGYAARLGANAAQYYRNYCSVENMVQGFIDAIEGTRLAGAKVTVGSDHD